MKNGIVIMLMCFIGNLSAQPLKSYFKGEKLYCPTESVEAMELFKTGIKTLHLNTSLNKNYLDKTADIFFRAYQLDTTFCDAAFFTGYTYRLMDSKNSLVFYYMADSLANNKSVEFKINLANEALKFDKEYGVKLARKKYLEVVNFFPDDPEGYYGMAFTSIIIGDVKDGLENINMSIYKYLENSMNVNDDVYFLKAILLTMNGYYYESIDLFKESVNYKNNDQYKTYYALSLLKISEKNNDIKMKKKAQKLYKKIKNKDALTDDIRKSFSY